MPQDAKRSLMASAAERSSRALGEFDIAQMRVFRQMAERHLSEALTEARKTNVLTAAADPSQFITVAMLNEFLDVATSAWQDGIALVTSFFDEPFTVPLFNSTIQASVHTAAGFWSDLLNKLIGDKAFKTLREPIYGEFLKGNLVQYGDIRPMFVALGGGSPDPIRPMIGGIATGQTTQDWLGQNGVETTEQKIWLYGYEDEPRRTFQGHLQMDGLVFTDWDSEDLLIAPQDYWLRVSHYSPGDHWGCACVVAPFIPNFGEEYQIEI